MEEVDKKTSPIMKYRNEERYTDRWTKTSTIIEYKNEEKHRDRWTKASPMMEYRNEKDFRTDGQRPVQKWSTSIRKDIQVCYNDIEHIPTKHAIKDDIVSRIQVGLYYV